MPTVGIYVPIKIARAVAAGYNTNVSDPAFAELVRGICAAALDEEADFQHSRAPKDSNCEYAQFHVAGRYCRHCGGT